jgi:biotin-dependent carboxylase-like uncharacterized protein
MSGLKLLAGGPLALVQDPFGRVGFQRFGVPVSGALDSTSLRVANLVVGNADTDAGLEVFYKGPVLEVDADSARVAAVGASLVVRSSDGERRIASGRSVRVCRGERIEMGACESGLVAYLAVEGGIAVEPFLGSRATYLRAAFGGLDGKAVRKGDALPLARESVAERAERQAPKWDLSPPARVRVVPGPQDDWFTARGMRTLLKTAWTVSRQSDRMGVRLEGPAIEHAKGYNIVSDGIAPGAIQVPGNGLPIVLLADRQTTGGYPKIATVASADLPAFGRLAPGATIRFEAVSVEKAEAARRELERGFDELRAVLALGQSS